MQEGKQRAGVAMRDATESVRQTLPALQPKIPFVEPMAGGSGAARAIRRFPVGSCFNCGDPGHFQRECPKMAFPRLEYSCMEPVVMEGVDGWNVHVSPCMWEGGRGECVIW